MENPSSNQENSPQTGIQKIVGKWVQLYAPNFERDPEVDRKIEELTVNYMSLLLVKADEIADFKRTENIQAKHVISGISTLNAKRGQIRGTPYFPVLPIFVCIFRVLKPAKYCSTASAR